MSAFQVSQAHIAAMLEYGISLRTGRCQGQAPYFNGVRLDETNAHHIGLQLVEANLRSLKARYGDSAEELVSYSPAEFALDWKPRNRRISPVEALKLCACFDYQACEDPAYPQSPAGQFVDQLRHMAISELPGYEDAPWELSDRRDS